MDLTNQETGAAEARDKVLIGLQQGQKPEVPDLASEYPHVIHARVQPRLSLRKSSY